jgi:hypothetical protein
MILERLFCSVHISKIEADCKKGRLFMEIAETAEQLATASPTVLALLLGLAAVGVVGLALFVVLRLVSRKDP